LEKFFWHLFLWLAEGFEGVVDDCEHDYSVEKEEDLDGWVHLVSLLFEEGKEREEEKNCSS
jgi:hypothetical protein